MTAPQARRFDVDGEIFEMTGSMPGQVHFTWITGPNPGYGFTSAGRVPAEYFTDEFITTRLRDFLAEIDPETGYLAEMDDADADEDE